jgi:hypothetical protein
MPTTYAIPDGRTVMAATLYTGDGTANRVISGLSFTPDFIWIKNRSSTWDHVLGNYVATSGIGTPITLASNSTAAEVDGGYIGAQTTNSLKLAVSAGENRTNGNTLTYVAWQWNAGGSTVTNTDGTISAQVRANPTAGFSVVTYTGTGATSSGVTIGHGLGATPAFVITKKRSGGTDYGWSCWHKDLGGNYGIWLDKTSARNIGMWAGYTNFSSTVFSPPDLLYGNENGATYVNYCFADVEGYSKFGSYTGNGSTDGPFVYLGFRPRFVLIKMSTGVAFWRIHDTSRNPYNIADLSLYPNANYADTTAVSEYWDILSNGFKLRTSDGEQNTSGATYIYAAFAENPFKYANAR